MRDRNTEQPAAPESAAALTADERQFLNTLAIEELKYYPRGAGSPDTELISVLIAKGYVKIILEDKQTTGSLCLKRLK